jgi:hypothetical protein
MFLTQKFPDLPDTPDIELAASSTRFSSNVERSRFYSFAGVP